MNENTRDNNSVPLDAEPEQLTTQELAAVLDEVCDEYDSVRDDLLSRFREQARQDRVGGDWE